MLSLLRRISLIKLLIATATLFVIPLIYLFVADFVIAAQKEKTAYTGMHNFVEIMEAGSHLATALQIERGIAASQPEKLPEVIKDTDAQIAEFGKAVAEYDTAKKFTEIQKAVVESVAAIRASQASPEERFAAYSALLEKSIKNTRAIALEAKTTGGYGKVMTQLLDFELLKESVAASRGLGAYFLAGGAREAAVENRLRLAISTGCDQIPLFSFGAFSEKSKESYSAFTKDQKLHEFCVLADTIRTGKPVSVTKEQYFTMGTTVVKSLNTFMETALAETHDKLAKETERLASAFILNLFIFTVVFLLIIGVPMLFFIRLRGDIVKVNKAINSLTADIQAGNLHSAIDAEQFPVDFKPIAPAVDAIRVQFVEKFAIASDALDKFAHGLTTEKITEEYQGDFTILKTNINACVDAFAGLVEQTGVILHATHAGDLTTRANADNMQGVYRKIIRGINETLDNVAQPLAQATNYMERISHGDIPSKIQEEQQGDYEKLRLSINRAVDAMNNMINEVAGMIEQVMKGRLSERINASGYEGGWAEFLYAVNELADGLVKRLRQNAVYMDRIAKGDMPELLDTAQKGEFEQMRESINRMITNISGVAEGMVEFTVQAQSGDLHKIAFDEKKYTGIYREIFSGLNAAAQTIQAPLTETLSIMQHVADGNLSKGMEGSYRGVFEELKQAINTSIESLNELLIQVNTAVEQVNAGSTQVADASQGLSQGATEAAASLEQISSSLQEIASQTKQNAENAHQANMLSSTSRESAEKGNGQMKQLAAAMTEINDASKRVSKIIKTIDEIAFQTNVLALNAAVEAARAGEHGRGFAVVADEVRDLADRSARAAKETSEMIEESLKKVENGVKLSQKTETVLGEIVTSSKKVTDIVAEIAAASNEQAQGISQIGSGLNQLEGVTQQVTANAEESAAASEELSSQSQHLKGMLARFKLQGMTISTATSSQTFDRRGTKQHNQSSATLIAPRNTIKLDDDDFGRF